MGLIRKRDIIRGVRSKWLSQYQDYADERVVGWADCTAGDIRAALAQLDLEMCSQEDVDAALRTTGWAANCCDECKEDFDVLLRIGEEPSYDAVWQDLCIECLRRACQTLEGAIGQETQPGATAVNESDESEMGNQEKPLPTIDELEREKPHLMRAIDLFIEAFGAKRNGDDDMANDILLRASVELNRHIDSTTQH